MLRLSNWINQSDSLIPTLAETKQQTKLLFLILCVSLVWFFQRKGSEKMEQKIILFIWRKWIFAQFKNCNKKSVDQEDFNSYWRKSTNPDTSKKKYDLLKLMQESSMIPLSWFMKKNKNLNLGKKVHFVLKTVLFTSNKAKKLHF